MPDGNTDPIDGSSHSFSAHSSHNEKPVGAGRRTFLKTVGVLSLFGGGTSRGIASDDGSDHRNAKTRSTIYTQEMRAAARENVERFDWAAQERDAAVSVADGYLERFGYEGLWKLVTSQSIPRAARPAFGEGGWSRVGYDGPTPSWEMTDGEVILPTNDFAAYRESGLDDRGTFDPGLADEQYLVNERYPDKPDDWGVDDGFGWTDEAGELGPAGTTWTIVAYYNFWLWWDDIRSMLATFGDAYLYTGETRYAGAGTILLDRIADVYPALDVNSFTKDYPDSDFWISHGGRSTGKAMGSHREPELMMGVIDAYDAVFPGQDDEDLVAFLSDKADEYEGFDDLKRSVSGIRKNIEDGIVRQMLPAAETSYLAPHRGAPGTVAQSARVLDEPDGYTAEAIDYVFRSRVEEYGYTDDDGNWRVDGGNVLSTLVDSMDRDGYGNEGAPNYNVVVQESMREVGDVLQGYDGYDGADLYDHPKFKRMCATHFPLLMFGQYTPRIGDTRGLGASWEHPEVDEGSIRSGFEVYDEPVFAQVAYLLNGNTTEGLRGSIFDDDPNALQSAIEDIIDEHGPYDPGTTHHAGFGFTAFRDGDNFLNRSFGTTLDTSDLFVEASTEVDDSFPEAIQLEANDEGEWWEFEFEVDGADEYELEIEALFVGSYGFYELYVDGELIDTVDFYAASSTRDTISYSVELEAGSHTMRWENVGKNEDSSNYKMALYNLTLLDAEDREIRDDVAELGNAQRALWMYYGRNHREVGTTHSHRDTLNVGLFGYGLDLSPDLGYPENTGDWPKRWNWTSNTISHNTVVVDEEPQHPQWAALPRHFDSTEVVDLVDVEAPNAYPQTETYRRTTALVRVDEGASYAVDCFRVDGGDDHHFSFHGGGGAVSTDGLDLVAQGGGTYAGADVPFPDNGEDTPYNEAVGNGFNYLYDVERDDHPDEQFSVEWDVEDTYGLGVDADAVSLRLTVLGDLDEVALANGDPPQRDGNPEALRYLVGHRSGPELDSAFTSVIEPYANDRVVESVERVSVQADGVEVDNPDVRAVKVTLATGRTDYVVSATDTETVYTIDDTFRFKGFFGVYAKTDGEPVYAYTNDAQLLQGVGDDPVDVRSPRGHVSGTVVDFTRSMSHENEIEVRVEGPQVGSEQFVGNWIYVENDGRRNATYEIHGVNARNDNRIVLDVGEQTPIREFVEGGELDGEYVYNFEEGASFEIPLHESWQANE